MHMVLKKSRNIYVEYILYSQQFFKPFSQAPCVNKEATAVIQGTCLICCCRTAGKGWLFCTALKRYTTALWFSIWPLNSIPGGDTAWEHCWYHVHRVPRAQPNPFHFQKLDKAFQLLIWLHSHDRCPKIKKPAQFYFSLNGSCKTQMILTTLKS